MTEGFDEEAAWAAGTDWDSMLGDLSAIRARQIEMLSRYDETAWERPRDTYAWGYRTLRWLITKSYQHGADHVSNILRIALRWDDVAARHVERTASLDTTVRE